jgi:hypothetical protein
LAPEYADAHDNPGNVLKETNQLELAMHAYHYGVYRSRLRLEYHDAQPPGARHVKRDDY